MAAEGSYRAHLLFRKLRSPPGTQKRRGRRYFSYGQPYRQGYARCLRFVDTVDATDSSDCPDANLTRPALASPRLVDTASNMSCRSHQSLCRGCGVELSRGLTSSGWTAGCVEPRYDKAMRLRCRASAGLQFELQRHLQIHPLRDFVFVVAAGAVVVGTKLQTAPHARWPWA